MHDDGDGDGFGHGYSAGQLIDDYDTIAGNYDTESLHAEHGSAAEQRFHATAFGLLRSALLRIVGLRKQAPFIFKVVSSYLG
ncbi:MAG: hypothetical protein DMG71_04870 [Acidobacteria bacterium]|nr:MAG: hypothetical protein DMG71_04870 [Acidobacteriota bacterium]